MEAFPGGERFIRCRACEEALDRPKIVPQAKYGIVPTNFGALLRVCGGCKQLWLGYMQELPKGGHKIIMKMIDKEL